MIAPRKGITTRTNRTRALILTLTGDDEKEYIKLPNLKVSEFDTAIDKQAIVPHKCDTLKRKHCELSSASAMADAEAMQCTHEVQASHEQSNEYTRFYRSTGSASRQRRLLRDMAYTL